MTTRDDGQDLAARLAVLEERLADMEARDAESGGLEGLVTRLFPSEVRGHLRSARKEQLLAARALLDHWIARLDRAPAERIRRRESIDLE